VRLINNYCYCRINVGVPQITICSHSPPPHQCFSIYTHQPSSYYSSRVGNFACDKAVLACGIDLHLASHYVQDHLQFIQTWYREWGVKMNETKSIYPLHILTPTGDMPDPPPEQSTPS